MTTQGSGTQTNISLNVNNTPASALQPVSDFIRDEYIKEKQTEANNRSYKALNSFYEDQLDATGKVAQKGLLTIASEAKALTPEKSSNYYDEETTKLYEYHKANKFQDLNNFEKKAIDAKYFATAGLLKTKTIEEARLNLIQENKDIDDDFFVKQAQLLNELGPMFIEGFEKNIASRVGSNKDYDEGVKKLLIKKYQEKGIEFLGATMAASQPMQFKEALKNGFFEKLSPVKALELDALADKNIKEQKFNTLLNGLDVPFDADPRDFVVANKEIKNKTFGGNENLQSIYSSLKPQEKIEFEKEYQSKAKAMNADRNINILTANAVGKVEAAQRTNKIFDEFAKKKGVYTDTLKRLFPKNQPAVEQLVGFNLKIANGSANQMSKFDSNDDIIKLIINDNVNTVYDKFKLVGETESKSIMERVGTQLNVADAKYLNNLLGISGDKSFKDNHNKFFEFVDNFGIEVSGSTALKGLDPKRDERLNNFKYTMYGRYINGLKQGFTSEELLKATKGNKKFIAYDFHTFIPNMNDVFKSINSAIETTPSKVSAVELLSLKAKKEKELGRKISAQEFLTLTSNK
tara:strand:+ start:529 stop:2256 length:1728 start_codon:yes stop_codon:yes gene_type:complete